MPEQRVSMLKSLGPFFVAFAIALLALAVSIDVAAPMWLSIALGVLSALLLSLVLMVYSYMRRFTNP